MLPCVCVRDFSWLEFIMSATDSNFYKTSHNVQREKTKLFYLIKLWEASLKNGKGTMSKVGERDVGGTGGIKFFLRKCPNFNLGIMKTHGGRS